MRGVLTFVSCPIVDVNLQVYLLLERVSREGLTIVISPLLMLWPLINLKL